jgi:molybdopterin biosynthesis enzyme
VRKPLRFAVSHPKQGARRMKAKIFSVRADQDFRPISVGDDTGRISANEYLEQKSSLMKTQRSKSGMFNSPPSP